MGVTLLATAALAAGEEDTVYQTSYPDDECVSGGELYGQTSLTQFTNGAGLTPPDITCFDATYIGGDNTTSGGVYCADGHILMTWYNSTDCTIPISTSTVSDAGACVQQSDTMWAKSYCGPEAPPTAYTVFQAAFPESTCKEEGGLAFTASLVDFTANGGISGVDLTCFDAMAIIGMANTTAKVHCPDGHVVLDVFNSTDCTGGLLGQSVVSDATVCVQQSEFLWAQTYCGLVAPDDFPMLPYEFGDYGDDDMHACVSDCEGDGPETCAEFEAIVAGCGADCLDTPDGIEFLMAAATDLECETDSIATPEAEDSPTTEVEDTEAEDSAAAGLVALAAGLMAALALA